MFEGSLRFVVFIAALIVVFLVASIVVEGVRHEPDPVAEAATLRQACASHQGVDHLARPFLYCKDGYVGAAP